MKKNVWIILIIGLSLFLNIYGIQWGVPDEERIRLVFGNTDIVQQVSPKMKESRDEIREPLRYVLQERNYVERKIKLKVEGKELTILRSYLDSARSYLIRSYGPDEQRPLVSLAGMKPSKLDFDPRLFTYGGGYIYPLGIFLKLLSSFKILNVQSDYQYYFQHPGEMGKMFIAARVFGAIFCSLAVYMMFLIGALLYGRRAGLIAAFLFCLTPVIVLWSHYLSHFSYSLFWMCLAFYFSLKLFRTGKTKYYVFSGIACGIAAGSLIHYGYILFAVLLAHIFRGVKDGKRLGLAIRSLFCKQILISILLFLASFLIVNPYYIISFKDALAEFSAASKWWESELFFFNWIYYFYRVLPYQFGWLLWLGIIVGILYSVCRHTMEDVFLLILFVPFYIYISSSTTYYAHYGIPLVPLLILFVARIFDQEDGFIRKILLLVGKVEENVVIRKKVTFLIPVVVIGTYTFLLDFSYDRLFVETNVRTEAGQWIDASIEKGKSIGMIELPSPWRIPPINLFKYRIVVTERDKSVLEEKKPEYFIVNEFQWLRGVGFEKIKDFLENYEEIKRFEKRPQIFGLVLVSGKDQPWDWPYSNPVILVFRRK